MIIIFEGLDGVGKTTICNHISKKYNFIYIKGTYTPSDKDKINSLIDLFSKLFDDKIYIYDRCPIIDDFIYNFIDNKEPIFKDYIDIIKVILDHCKIIHLTITEYERNKRFLDRGDEYITNDNIKTISDNYKQFYKELGCMVYLFPLSNNINNDIQKIYNIIQCK